MLKLWSAINRLINPNIVKDFIIYDDENHVIAVVNDNTHEKLIISNDRVDGFSVHYENDSSFEEYVSETDGEVFVIIVAMLSRFTYCGLEIA